MGFPVGYTDVFLPKLILYILSFLGYIRKFTHALLSILGFTDFIEAPTTSYPARHESTTAIIRELLPVVRFADLVGPPESCAVCLHEFEGEDEIRRLANCRHVFHRRCVDRWMEQDRVTCPLCRARIVPEEAVDEKVWAGISDLYGEYAPIAAGL